MQNSDDRNNEKRRNDRVRIKVPGTDIGMPASHFSELLKFLRLLLVLVAFFALVWLGLYLTGKWPIPAKADVPTTPTIATTQPAAQ